MEKKFNVGDRVRSKFYGIVGTIIDVDKDGYIINPDHLDEMWIAEDDAERYDRKTAFLSELKELLKKYGANIYDYEQYKLIIDFDNGDSVSWYWGNKPIRECALTPDNIMDYDKE